MNARSCRVWAGPGVGRLAVVAVVLAVVSVSGSHLNPAVSLAMGVFGYLPRAHGLPYLAAAGRLGVRSCRFHGLAAAAASGCGGAAGAGGAGGASGSESVPGGGGGGLAG
jgi:hypothetical protein